VPVHGAVNDPSQRSERLLGIKSKSQGLVENSPVVETVPADSASWA